MEVDVGSDGGLQGLQYVEAGLNAEEAGEIPWAMLRPVHNAGHGLKVHVPRIEERAVDRDTRVLVQLRQESLARNQNLSHRRAGQLPNTCVSG